MLFCSALVAMSLSSYAGNTISLDGVEFSLDTLYHAKVGPGTTQTSLHLVNEAKKQQLRVFYLTVDLSNPNIAIRSVMANDKLAVGAPTSSMAKSHSTADATYFAGINTDFYFTSGNASNGSTIVGTPIGPAVVDGELYRTSTIGSVAWPQFVIDKDGKPLIGAASFSNGRAYINGKSTAFSVVNNDAPYEGIAVYTPRYYGITNQPGSSNRSSTAIARLADGSQYLKAGGVTKLVITAAPVAGSDVTIPAGSYAIVGCGSTAKSMVDGLSVGDEVTLESKIELGNSTILPQQLTSGNPWIVENGVNRKAEGDRPDAPARHPRSAIGYDKDGKTMIMLVVDGRSAISAGVHANELADLMLYAGAYTAINVDGGGSSTLYTSAFGVRNQTSDGRERSVSCAMFAVANAPADDKTVTEIRFADWAMQFPRYGVYHPVIYGYNRYGVLVDTDVEGYTLSCDSKIGEITNNGTQFFGTGSGTGALKATYNGLEASIPVTISSASQVKLRLDKAVLDSRSYKMEVLAVLPTGEEMPLSADALTWSSDNTSVATVDAATGIVRGISNGTANITGKVDDFTGTMALTVEIPEGNSRPVTTSYASEDWKMTQIGGKGIAIAPYEQGFKLTYTGNGASRGANITATAAAAISSYSLPSDLRMRINPGEAEVKKISVSASNNLGERISAWQLTDQTLSKNTETELTAKLSAWCNPADIASYPATVYSLRFDLGASASGKAFEILVPRFEWVYDGNSGVSAPAISGKTMTVYPSIAAAGTPVSVIVDEPATVSVYAINGALVGTTRIENAGDRIPTDGLHSGMYIVKASTASSTATAKLLIR